MKRAWLIPLAALCLSLAGCDLMPVEETYRASPIIRDYPAVEYTLAACTRGDMTLSRSISCTYVPVRTAGLSFQTGGLYYDTAFVSPGDAVEEGQLLFQPCIHPLSLLCVQSPYYTRSSEGKQYLHFL